MRLLFFSVGVSQKLDIFLFTRLGFLKSGLPLLFSCFGIVLNKLGFCLRYGEMNGRLISLLVYLLLFICLHFLYFLKIHSIFPFNVSHLHVSVSLICSLFYLLIQTTGDHILIETCLIEGLFLLCCHHFILFYPFLFCRPKFYGSAKLFLLLLLQEYLRLITLLHDGLDMRFSTFPDLQMQTGKTLDRGSKVGDISLKRVGYCEVVGF